MTEVGTAYHAPAYSVVEPGSEEDRIIREEKEVLAGIQRNLADRQFKESSGRDDFDRDLVALRDQISEANIEDVAPLVAEMYRLQALGQRSGAGRELPIDVACPYFGHLRLEDHEGNKVRDVFIGNRGYVPTGAGFAIVDWRNAPVSRIYYRYDEGDDYEEIFGGRESQGIVRLRRTIGIQDGELRRVSWPTGTVAKRGDGVWVRLAEGERPMLRGGAGTASRPPAPHKKLEPFRPGKLGVVGDESLREDKHLKAITALIDKKQFELITQPESGIVILQGGAGSGKTTVALHRAAYLYYQNPQVYSPKKMAVVVRSPALVEYISRILPSLGVEGIRVLSLGDWMRTTRLRVLPASKREIAKDVPGSVARLKKHPGVLMAFEAAVREEGDSIGQDLAKIINIDSVKKKWEAHAKLALIPRIKDMQKWLESAQATRAGVTPRARDQALGMLRRARAEAADILSLWAYVLTDFDIVWNAVHERRAGTVEETDVRDLVRWVSQQAEELEPRDENEDEDEPPKSRRDKKAAEHAMRKALELEDDEGLSRRAVDADDDVMRGIGVDGRFVDEGSPVGKFDEHDDALLLRIVQLRYGSLPIPQSQKSVQYEHLVVDEAQDLSPTDIAVLRGTLTRRESMTLAGDTAQKLVFDNGFDDWKSLLLDLGIQGVELEPLRISYRSTQEIVDFSRYILGPYADPVEPIAVRHGAPVEPFSFGTTGEAVAFLAEALRSLALREKRASVAVVARYAMQANLYFEALRNAEVPALRRIYGKEFTFSPGIDVVDVTQVKGLEYDYVVMVEVNEQTYPDAKEARHLLHIGATRAVHQLWINSVGKPSSLLPPDQFTA